MATGPEHYREAERLIEDARGESPTVVAERLAEAQVHATLALAGATAMAAYLSDEGGMPEPDARAWDRVAGVQSEEA